MTVTEFVPYSTVSPSTTDLRELRVELDRVRDIYGPGSSQGEEAFQRLSVEAFRQGRPLDALHYHTTDEVERFFARTIQGPDGHVYWDTDTTHRFRRNDGLYRAPARWWWEHVHGPIGSTTRRVSPTCGEKSCINPEHSKCANFNTEKRRSESELLGALQVAAMRLGHTPRAEEWVRLKLAPSPTIFQQRFGSWQNAIRAAGLKYQPVGFSPDQCIESILFARNYLGEWPSWKHFRERRDLRKALAEAGLPMSTNVVYKHLGPTWNDALQKAGKP